MVPKISLEYSCELNRKKSYILWITFPCMWSWICTLSWKHRWKNQHLTFLLAQYNIILCITQYYVLSHVWFFVILMNYGLPGPSVHGIFQARILEWVTISFSRGSSQLRGPIHISCIAGRFFTAEPPRRSKQVQQFCIGWYFSAHLPYGSEEGLY